MKVLIFGADGMLGHQLVRQFSDLDAVGTTRTAQPLPLDLAHLGVRIVQNVDVRNFGSVETLLTEVRPTVVINSAGIVKQRHTSDPQQCIEVNSLFPHRLSSLADGIGARLLHISTDCVFSGAKGFYSETDLPDPVDLYGRSKLLGEISDSQHVVTLRTSIIGLELYGRQQGLIEWALSQRSPIRGFTQAKFSGMTTLEFSRVVRFVCERPSLHGLFHVASSPISKYELLRDFLELLGDRPSVLPADQPIIDRSLDASKFGGTSGFRPSPWAAQLSELASSTRQRTG